MLKQLGEQIVSTQEHTLRCVFLIGCDELMGLLQIVAGF